MYAPNYFLCACVPQIQHHTFPEVSTYDRCKKYRHFVSHVCSSMNSVTQLAQNWPELRVTASCSFFSLTLYAHMHTQTRTSRCAHGWWHPHVRKKNPLPIFDTRRSGMEWRIRTGLFGNLSRLQSWFYRYSLSNTLHHGATDKV